MNNHLYTKQQLFKIVSLGKYYYPAYTHYSITPTNVRCDFCSKSNLECAIGYEDKDLCMNCVEVLANENKLIKLEDIYKQPPQPVITRMMQSSVRTNPPNNQPRIYTNMMQDSVRRNQQVPDNLTFMMQDSIRFKGYDNADY